jgi:hypothetical protein
MRKYTGTGAQGPLVVVHAGARSFEGARDLLAARKAAVADAVGAVWPRLQGGLAAVDAVTALVERLEDAPSCNAGRGGALQSDGLARLSASVMDGARQRFSGVLLVTHLVHPSRLARALQEREETVLGPLGAQLLARELGIPPEAPALPETAEEWLEYLKDPATSGEHGGTVGAPRRAGVRRTPPSACPTRPPSLATTPPPSPGSAARAPASRSWTTGWPCAWRRASATAGALSKPPRSPFRRPSPPNGTTAGLGSTATAPGRCAARPRTCPA